MAADAAAATIFAVAAGGGRAALTVVRLSGPATGAILDRLCRTHPAPRRAALRTLRSPAGEVLDRALTLWFPGPASYTGEDCAELHLHGGHAVLQGVADALAGLGARPAEPGEFTRRAFLNGRMDLLEAEAVADLVAAETSAQRQQALRQLDGVLGALYGDWSAELVRLLAQQEALIDFPDDDLPAEIGAALATGLATLRQQMLAHLDDGHRGERLREGLLFVVVGPPNAGKSTLVNALAGRDVAIVSPLAGTTRDIVATRAVFGGVPVTLLDTAGLRDSDDPVEAEGVRRAYAQARQADLLLMLTDGSGGAGLAAPAVAFGGVPALQIATKSDLCLGAAVVTAADLHVSAATGAGMDALRDRLGVQARRLVGADGPPALTRARHRVALQLAAGHLAAALAADLAELRGEDMRAALRCLGSLTGRVGVEAVLDAVFSQFCIGK